MKNGFVCDTIEVSIPLSGLTRLWAENLVSTVSGGAPTVHEKERGYMDPKKAAVFIILGQSNAVGHGIPMKEEDKIHSPLKNVFGLHRRDNQSFENTALTWSGYTSAGMNLAEEQDDTYSIPNCLGALWQAHIDAGNELELPDLYIVQIAIGAQGVTEGYMWHPERERRLIPGRLGEVDISLFPYSMHIFNLLKDSFVNNGLQYDIIGLHWRGGENDTTTTMECLNTHLKDIYTRMLDAYNRVLDHPPIVLHRLCCPDRMTDLDPMGESLLRMEKINEVFTQLSGEYANVSVFDPRTLPQFIPDVRCNGIFIEDAVHFTPEVNRTIAAGILDDYAHTLRKI